MSDYLDREDATQHARDTEATVAAFDASQYPTVQDAPFSPWPREEHSVWPRYPHSTLPNKASVSMGTRLVGRDKKEPCVLVTMNSLAVCDKVATLAQQLRNAEEAHAKYESALGHKDSDWPTWYASFILNGGGF